MMGGMNGRGWRNGSEHVEESVRRNGFFGTEQVVEDVRTDMFGNREVREEVVDKDMFGRVVGVREETVDEPRMMGGGWRNGSEHVEENVRRNGFFGTEQVVEDV